MSIRESIGDRIAGRGTDVTVFDSKSVERMERMFSSLESENIRFHEELTRIEFQMEDNGWDALNAYGQEGGLSLGQAKNVSRRLRELVIGNPIVKRGSQLRITYAMGAGLEFAASNKQNGKQVGLTGQVQTILDRPRNVQYLFANGARAELERCAFADGTLFCLGDDRTHDVQRVPISQICGDLRNPDNFEEIWAYRRRWFGNPDAEKEEDRQEKIFWYYTDLYEGRRYSFISSGFSTTNEPVDKTKTMIAQAFNKQVGFAYGIPDAISIMAWAKLHREYMVNGYIMSRALARIAYKVTGGTTQAQSNAQAEFALPGQAGSTAVEGQGQNLQALSTAGKGYDFSGGRDIAALIAAGLEVSVDALLAGSGGESTGATQATIIDGTARATATMRRGEWDDFWVRLLRWMGNGKKLKVIWHDVPADTIYRLLQGWAIAHDSGLFEGDKIQKGMADALSIADPGNIPAGYMLPNNSESQDRADVDADGNPVQPGDTAPGSKDDQGPQKSTKPTGPSGQGKSTRRGKSPNDHTTDNPNS